MTKVVAPILLTLALSSALYGQDNYSTGSLSVGAGSIRMKDQFQSPYTYKGISPSFSAAYTSTTPKRKHNIHVGYATGKIQSVVSPLADNRLLLLNYDYLANVIPVTASRKFSFSTGPGIHAFLSRTNYLPEVALSKTYLSASMYLSLTGDVACQLSTQGRLELRMSVPLFGFAYRPDFEINGGSLTKAAPPGKGMLFNTRLQYVYNLRSQTDLIVSYHLSYFRFNEPRPVYALWNGLQIGVSRKF